MPKIKNEINNVYGRLKVKEFDCLKKDGVHWICECQCGNIVSVRGTYLRSGMTKSCGCLQREKTSEMNSENKRIKYCYVLSADGEMIPLSSTRCYSTWKCMRSRCLNPKDKCFDNYGEKNIKICDEWINDPVGFYAMSLALGYKEQSKNIDFKSRLSIDRIDPNGNYYPNNCRWITISENSERVLR